MKSRLVHPGDFLLSNSMSFGRPYISKIDGCIHDGWLAISDFSASFIPDFLYHLLRSAPIQGEFARRAGAGTVRNLNADIVKAVVLPVPPLEEQARIVAILDKFDALMNDLSAGLPAELAARRKQYEHYRDRLLTFKESAA
jgi:type I restriction enzyme S subunit